MSCSNSELLGYLIIGNRLKSMFQLKELGISPQWPKREKHKLRRELCWRSWVYMLSPKDINGIKELLLCLKKEKGRSSEESCLNSELYAYSIIESNLSNLEIAWMKNKREFSMIQNTSHLSLTYLRSIKLIKMQNMSLH